MTHLAAMLLKGIGCVKDIENGIHWLKEAVNANNLDAMNALSHVYQTNHIFKKMRKAVDLLHEAAEKGHSESQTDLAQLYERGVEMHLEPNLQKALQLYREAANADYPRAQNNLAALLLQNADDNSTQMEEAVNFFFFLFYFFFF